MKNIKNFALIASNILSMNFGLYYMKKAFQNKDLFHENNWSNLYLNNSERIDNTDIVDKMSLKDLLNLDRLKLNNYFNKDYICLYDKKNDCSLILAKSKIYDLYERKLERDKEDEYVKQICKDYIYHEYGDLLGLHTGDSKVNSDNSMVRNLHNIIQYNVKSFSQSLADVINFDNGISNNKRNNIVSEIRNTKIYSGNQMGFVLTEVSSHNSVTNKQDGYSK